MLAPAVSVYCHPRGLLAAEALQGVIKVSRADLTQQLQMQVVTSNRDTLILSAMPVIPTGRKLPESNGK